MDVEETVIRSIRMPKAFESWFWGAFSNLTEINNWEEYGTLTPDEMVDIAVNEVVIVDFCSMVASCIETSEEVQEALAYAISQNSALQNAVNNITHQLLTAGSGTGGQESQFDDLDYVWGGILGAMEEYDNAVNAFALVANSAANAEEFLLNSLVPKYLTQTVVDKVTSAFSLGVTAIISFFEDPDSRNTWGCGVFDAICNRGSPYIIYPDDLTAAWDELNILSSFGIPGISDLVKTFFSVDKGMALFKVSSDEPDDDWTILCSCTATEKITYEFTQESGSEPNTVYGNSWVPVIGTYSSGNGYIASWQPIPMWNQVRLDRASFPSQTVLKTEIQFTVVNQAAVAGSQMALFLTEPLETIIVEGGTITPGDSPFIVNTDFTLDVGQEVSPEFRGGNISTVITIQRIIMTFAI